MKNRILEKIPPGYQFDNIWVAYWIGYTASVFISFTLLKNYAEQRSQLYVNYAGKILKPGAVMPDFVDLVGISFMGFILLAAASMAVSYIFYRYFTSDTKSIYLMKRLPSKYELASRCLTVPAAGALFSTGSGLILLILYFALYMATTPDECLAPGQVEKLWRCVLCWN